ncbi:rCG30023 [Rattus norvegicus]|uniref:RCG30023 n=2 Tax=Rattus norvegicus TaxID=10116 RepID=A6IM89_RAT|nr:rCG30023 [Rattus norvegicus]|eukprot:XP_017447978.1 PREDICTED: ly49 inhibitory receptor 2 isoform X1 [Rattus norvegicus]
MTEQEVTYTTVRFHKSSVFQNEVRSEETQSAKEIGHRESSVPWKLIVIALGILCSVLLVTVAVLVTNCLQYNHETHELQETQNSQHNCSTMENDIKLKEEMLRNMSIESTRYNALLDLINREQKRWYNKTKTVLAAPQHTGGCVEMHWLCYGIKCYYFIIDKRTWRKCI